ncbi:MAG TPA: OmpW family outer membrane protein [Thermoanaerobaculia bacterium]|nr:OmpW family outer membrane protein [Thermoanaerobaculia bacterium]
MKSLKTVLGALLFTTALPLAAADRSVDITGSVAFIHLNEQNEESLDVESDLGFTAGLNVFFGNRVSLDVTAGVFEPEASLDLPTSTVGRLKPLQIQRATVGKVKMIPLTAALLYHFAPEGRFDPYVGGGVEYILLGDFDNADDVDFERIDFEDDLGGMINAGVNIGFGRNLALKLDAKYVAIGDPVTTSGDIPVELELKPLTLSAGLSFRF